MVEVVSCPTVHLKHDLERDFVINVAFSFTEHVTCTFNNHPCLVSGGLSFTHSVKHGGRGGEWRPPP